MNNVKAGQVWRAVDKRFARHVHVVNVIQETGKAVIYSIVPTNGAKCGPTTQARLDRFNGKRGGYELVSDSVTVPATPARARGEA